MRDKTIDLNCDMGEGLDGADSAMLDIVSSANIAAGAHAGSLDRFKNLLVEADAKGVTCGIHPGFPDRPNFGRTRMQLPPAQITALVKAQITACAEIADALTINLPFVKVHGALANMAEEDDMVAGAIAQAVVDTDPARALVGMAGLGQAKAAADHGLQFLGEVFADRAYQPDGFLVPRTMPNAVLHDPTIITERIMTMIERKAVITNDGQHISATIDTVCVHGDTQGAVSIAKGLRAALEDRGFRIASAFRAAA